MNYHNTLLQQGLKALNTTIMCTDDIAVNTVIVAQNV